MTTALLARLARPSTATALVDVRAGRSWTYRELAVAVHDVASRLAYDRKCLVACLCRSDAPSVIGYLAALSAGHAVLMLDGTASAAVTDTLLDRYRPEYVVDAGACERRPGSPAPVHDDLAVLLCTSGSTGSSKVVRLSGRNIDANAAQIVEYLGIDDTERAVQTLPIHYSYGLSVLNSHLLAGAAVVLPGASIVRPEFWSAVRDHGCTSFAGVPYSYEMLTRIGFERFELPALRTLTQAGGRLAPDVVLRFANTMRERGGRFVVMYGQTEATARISYLPPERVLDKPGSVGVPVPGGRLSLADDGELLYEGPNVMLGYATDRSELAAGDVNGGRLATGDLGRVDDEGFFFVTGRKRRMAKLAGLRINLDELEAVLQPQFRAAALELGDQLVIVRETRDAPTTGNAIARSVGSLVGLPSRFVRVHDVEQLPVTSAGKTDYARIAVTLESDG